MQSVRPTLDHDGQLGTPGKTVATALKSGVAGGLSPAPSFDVTITSVSALSVFSRHLFTCTLSPALTSPSFTALQPRLI